MSVLSQPVTDYGCGQSLTDAEQSCFAQHTLQKILLQSELPDLVMQLLKIDRSHGKVRYRSLSKNTQQLHTLFALANLWIARARLLVSSPSKPGMPA